MLIFKRADKYFVLFIKMLLLNIKTSKSYPINFDLFGILKYIKTIKIIKQIIRADLMNISFGVF